MFAILAPMKLIIFSVLTLTLLSQKVFADSQIVSEAVLQINKTHIDQGIQNTLNAWANQPLTLTWARVDLPTSFPAWLENVKLQIQFKEADVKAIKTGVSWDFKSPTYTIKLTADKLQAKGRIIERRGNVRITVPIEGSCSQLSSTYTAVNNPLTVKTSLLKTDRTQLRLKIEDILFSFTKQNVATQISACEGPIGIKEFIDENIKSSLADQSLWLSRVKQTIENQLSYNFKLEQVLWKNPSLATQVTWLGDSWTESALSYKLNGKVSVHIGQTGQLHSVTELTLDEQSVSPDTTTLIVPKNLVSTLVTAWQADGLLSLNFSADDFKAFRDLQRSWFSLLFVWPDLLRYSSETTMSWLIQPVANSNAAVINSSGSPIVKLNTWARADLFALEDGRMVPYMNFTTPITTDFQLQASNGQMNLKILNMSNLNINAQWDADFVRKHNPNRKFAKETIGRKIREKVLNNAFSIPMQNLSPLPWLKMNLQNMNTAGGNINFDFNLTSGN